MTALGPREASGREVDWARHIRFHGRREHRVHYVKPTLNNLTPKTKENIMITPKHIISASAIVINDFNEILLIKGPQRGWEMPGGQVEEGESLAQAAIRETKEESGIDIEIIKFCGIYQNVERSICMTLFLAKQIGGEPIITNESLETKFIPLEEAKKMISKNNRKRLEACLGLIGEPIYMES